MEGIKLDPEKSLFSNEIKFRWPKIQFSMRLLITLYNSCCDKLMNVKK